MSCFFYLILADEPTEILDKKTGEEVMNGILKGQELV